MRFAYLTAAFVAAVAMAGVVAHLLARLPAWRDRAPTAYRYLLAASVAGALLSSAVGLPLLVKDRAEWVGIAATIVPPLVLSLAALAVGLTGMPSSTVVLWVIAVLTLAYVVVYGLGLGCFYLPTALLLFGAAIVRSTVATPPGSGSAG